jgi:RND family efflux transporter MFP subunit
VNRADSNLKLAVAEYDRLMRIKKQDPGAVSGAMVDRVTRNRETSEAELRNAKEELRIARVGARAEDIAAKEAEIRSLEASVESAEDQLRYTYLKAPFDGTVVAIYVENFEYVRAKQPITRLIDHAKIEMIVNIPENLIPYADDVTDLRARFDPFPEHVLEAQIKEIGKEASKTTRTYPVTLIMDQPKDVKILPGMAGKAWSEGKVPGGLGGAKIEVAETAVFSPDETQKTYVWVIDEKTNKVSRREVKPGQLSQFGITIEEGLKPGEWVATAGVHHLKEGQEVKILEESRREAS